MDIDEALVQVLALVLVTAACGGSEITKDEFVDELVAQNLFTRDQAVCFVDRIWDDIGPLDANKLASSDDFSAAEQAAVVEATLACLGVGDDSGPASGLSPDDPPPGDDAELDALWVLCGDGDADACDELFFTSPAGSNYEDSGLSCGGRGSGDCAAVIGASE